MYIVIFFFCLFLFFLRGGWKLLIIIELLWIELLRCVLFIYIILKLDILVVIMFIFGYKLYILLCVIWIELSLILGKFELGLGFFLIFLRINNNFIIML